MRNGLKKTFWSLLVSGFSAITFLGNFIYLKFSNDPNKILTAYHYNLYLYVGGIVAIIFFNGFKLEKQALGGLHQIKTPALIAITLIFSVIAEKISAITTILRFGLIRENSSIKVSLPHLITLILMLLTGLYLFQFHPGAFWQYFLGWISLIPLLGLLAFTGETIWIPSHKNLSKNNYPVIVKVAKRITFDTALIITPFIFLIFTKNTLHTDQLALYLEAIAAFGACGVLSMIMESKVLRTNNPSITKPSIEEVFFWISAGLIAFLAMKFFFGRELNIALITSLSAILLMIGGSLIGRLRKIQRAGVFVRQAALLITASTTICLITTNLSNSATGILVGFMLNSIVNVICYTIELRHGNI